MTLARTKTTTGSKFDRLFQNAADGVRVSGSPGVLARLGDSIVRALVTEAIYTLAMQQDESIPDSTIAARTRDSFLFVDKYMEER